MEKRTAVDWAPLFPHLSLLSRHYNLPTGTRYSLNELVLAVDCASMSDLLVQSGQSTDSICLAFLSLNPTNAPPLHGLAKLCQILIALSHHAFIEVLSKKEHSLYWDASIDLSPCTPMKNESVVEFCTRIWGTLSTRHADMQYFNLLEHCLPLSNRTEILLSIGGDDRLTLQIEASKLNKYLSTTLPRHGHLIRRGSCTCSTIVPKDYLLAETFRVNTLSTIIKNGANGSPVKSLTCCTSLLSAVDSLNDNIRHRITEVIDPAHTSRTILFPSGSDAELLPVLVALIRHSIASIASDTSAEAAAHTAAGVLNIVTASGEVGSGTPNACGGKHFSNVSPKGVKQSNNDYLDGICPSSVEVLQFAPRCSDGGVAFNEADIFSKIASSLASHPARVVILHIVCGSKTGLIYPARHAVLKLQSQFKSRLLVVVDACQLRCRLDIIADYIADGFIVLVTGSKFFTGPPFCGAVVLPISIATEIESYISNCHEKCISPIIPTGLQNYLTSADIPPTMPVFKKFLSNKCNWVNFPLALRWHVALDVMERFNKIPTETIKSFTMYWISAVKKLVANAHPYLQLVEVNYTPDDSAHSRALDVCRSYGSEMVGDVNSIVSVAIHVANGSAFRHLTVDESKLFFEKMTNMNGVVYMLGQPVKLSASGLTVLRIALGADMIVDTLTTSSDPIQMLNRMSTLLSEDAQLIASMVQLAKEWSGSASAPLSMYRVFNAFSSSASLYSTRSDAPLVKSTVASTTLPHISRVVQAFIAKETTFPNIALLFDMNAIQAAKQSIDDLASLSYIQHATNAKLVHCFALKACPVSYIAFQFIAHGFGIECASIVEVKHALQLGCQPSKIIFDSPCKTHFELHFAISNGVYVNANSEAELVKLNQIVAAIGPIRGPIGVRINTLVGAGSISALSTSTATSKFGIQAETSAVVIELFKKFSFLSALMCHVGSQGMPVSAMAEGAVALARSPPHIYMHCTCAQHASVAQDSGRCRQGVLSQAGPRPGHRGRTLAQLLLRRCRPNLPVILRRHSRAQE